MDTKEYFEKILEEEEKSFRDDKQKLISVFRENYDLWTEKLFPLWRAKGKSSYEMLAKLLNDIGYEVDESYVSNYLNRVKNERKSKSKKGVTPELKVEQKNLIAPAVVPSVEIVEEAPSVNSSSSFDYDEKLATAAVFVFGREHKVFRKDLEAYLDDKDLYVAEYLTRQFKPFEFGKVYTLGIEKVYQFIKITLKKKGMTPENWDSPELWQKTYGRDWKFLFESIKQVRRNFNLPFNFYKDTITGAKEMRGNNGQ